METPDLNAPSFATLTISRVVELAASTILEGERAAVIGSSMGGWAAAHFADRYPDRVLGMVLMCPAFNMPSLLERDLGQERMEEWRRSGVTLVEHPGIQSTHELEYGFMEDAWKWAARLPMPSCPILIAHGTRDEVVPLSLSESFAEKRPNIDLVTFDADHSLEQAVDEVVDLGVGFLERLRRDD